MGTQVEPINGFLPNKAELRAMEQLRTYAQQVQSVYNFDVEAKTFCPSYLQCMTALVTVADIYIDVYEVKSNASYLISKWTRRIGLKGDLPWCGIFIDQVFWDVSLIFGMPDLLPFNTAGTQTLANKAAKLGMLVTDKDLVTAGSLVIYADGNTGLGHIEMVTSPSDEWYNSIGGNTTDDSEINRDGNQVGVHLHVPWEKYGVIGKKHKTKRYTRGFVPLPMLYDRYWMPEIEKRKLLV